MISTAEAIMLAAMTAVVIAIAVPSYTAMHKRSDDSSARANVRQVADAVEAFRAEHGTYVGIDEGALRRYDPALSLPSFRLVLAGSGKRYCVESSSGGRSWHLEGPAGDLARGVCP